MSLISESWIHSFNNPNTESVKPWTQDEFFGEIRRLSGIPVKEEDRPKTEDSDSGAVVVFDEADKARAEKALTTAGVTFEYQPVMAHNHPGKNMLAVDVSQFDHAVRALDKAKVSHYTTTKFKLEAQPASTKEEKTEEVDAEDALDGVTEEFMALSEKLKKLGASQDRLRQMNAVWNEIITGLERKLGVGSK